MILRRIVATVLVVSLLVDPALATDRKPLVLGTSGQQQQIQSGDTLSVPAAKVTSISGSTQCVQASTAGLLSGTGASCGGTACTFANPTATAADTAVNGSATTCMRSDAAPAVQKASSSVFGIVKVDGTTITSSGGVISASSSGTTGYTWAFPNLASSTLSGAPAAATYGNCINLLSNVTVGALSMGVNQVSGATYVGAIYLLNSSFVIQGSAVGISTTYTAGATSTAMVQLTFSSPVSLTAGNTYAFVATRTDSTDTVTLNVWGTSTTNGGIWPSFPTYDGGFSSGRFCYLAKKSPASGNTFTTGTGAYHVGIKYYS